MASTGQPVSHRRNHSDNLHPVPCGGAYGSASLGVHVPPQNPPGSKLRARVSLLALCAEELSRQNRPGEGRAVADVEDREDGDGARMAAGLRLSVATALSCGRIVLTDRCRCRKRSSVRRLAVESQSPRRTVRADSPFFLRTVVFGQLTTVDAKQPGRGGIRERSTVRGAYAGVL